MLTQKKPLRGSVEGARNQAKSRAPPLTTRRSRDQSKPKPPPSTCREPMANSARPGSGVRWASRRRLRAPAGPRPARSPARVAGLRPCLTAPETHQTKRRAEQRGVLRQAETQPQTQSTQSHEKRSASQTTPRCSSHVPPNGLRQGYSMAFGASSAFRQWMRAA